MLVIITFISIISTSNSMFMIVVVVVVVVVVLIVVTIVVIIHSRSGSLLGVGNGFANPTLLYNIQNTGSEYMAIISLYVPVRYAMIYSPKP